MCPKNGYAVMPVGHPKTEACVWKRKGSEGGVIVTLFEPVMPTPVVLGKARLPRAMTSHQFNRWIRSEEGRAWAQEAMKQYI